MKGSRWILGALLALLTVLALHRGHRSVGYVRDEGIYFEASRRYAGWLEGALREPVRASSPKVRDRAFAFNHEHPPFLKTLGGVSARLFAESPRSEADPGERGGVWPIMPEGAAMRLPAQILGGLAVGALFITGSRLAGFMGGLLAAGWFVLLPRVWFNAGLHAFDVPVAVAILFTVLTYRRAARHPGWGVALGVVLGLAIATKHNALFVGPLLALHHWFCLAWARLRGGRRIHPSQWIPFHLVIAAIVAPLVAWALWPWLWHHPWERLWAYFEFHRQHSWYNMEFLGVNYNQPPMPVSYPWVLTWATVPSVLLLLSSVGAAVALGADLRRPPPSERRAASWLRSLPEGWPRHDGLLFALFALFPIVLIALPTTPIFGGTKHWLTAYPFLALLAAMGWSRLWKSAALSRSRVLEPLALVLVLLPGAVATIDAHPYGLSQYAPLAGGPRGAARMGLGRGFWGHAIVPALPELAQGARTIFLHDLHELVRRQYAREGRWPEGLQPAPATRSDIGLLFHERHMTTYETDLWNAMDTTAPSSVIILDDVPLTSIYRKAD